MRTGNLYLCASLLALQGFLAVALGAFAAHSLKNTLHADALVWWQTGSQYMMYHVLAGLLAVCFARHLPRLHLSAWAFVAANLVFSGSLFVMALTGLTWLGALTPLGGLLYLFAWGNLAYQFWRASSGTDG